MLDKTKDPDQKDLGITEDEIKQPSNIRRHSKVNEQQPEDSE